MMQDTAHINHADLNNIIDPIWLKSYPDGVPAQIDEAQLKTLEAMLRESFQKFGPKPAFISFGKTITYAELERDALSLLCQLQLRGLKQGDRVALMMPNVMAYPVCLAALILGGYIIVSANPLYTARELQHQLKDAGAKAIIVLEMFANVLECALPELNIDHVIIAKPGDFLGIKGKIINFVAKYIKKTVPDYHIPKAEILTHLVREGQGKTPKPVSIQLNDIAFLQYTGGTTGVSKGAVLTHKNLSANLEQNCLWFAKTLNSSPYNQEHCMVVALPLYHIYSLTCCAMMCLRIGASCLLIANPRDIPSFIKTLQTSKFTMMTGVNTLYNALLNATGFDKIDFSRISIFSAGGMAMQGPVAKRWKAATGFSIIEGYGLSETSPVLTINHPDITEFTGSIGYPISSTQIIILREDGSQAPVGEAGEICARGPQVMQGYWDSAAGNANLSQANVFTKDGFLKTGDIGILLEDGKIKIVDRLKDMILVSGFNVYPNEVEEVIAAIPQILEVAVVGMKDAAGNEAVSAFVVVKDNCLTADEIKEYCYKNLAHYKCPKRIIFKDVLPKTNVGKVLRRVLRDEAAKLVV
jgi:long-chain acyl-CoA synthetase